MGLEMMKDAMQQQRYLMVFCDIQMPVMDGFACVSKLREWEGTSGTEPHFIAGMSAYVSEQETAAAEQAGMSMLLSKPVHRSQILDLAGSRAQALRTVARSGAGGCAPCIV